MLAKQISRKKSRRRRKKIEISFVRGKFVKRREIPRKNFFPTTTAIDLAKKEGEKKFLSLSYIYLSLKFECVFFPSNTPFPIPNVGQMHFLRSAKKKRKRLFFLAGACGQRRQIAKARFFSPPEFPRPPPTRQPRFHKSFQHNFVFLHKSVFKGQTVQHAFYSLV